MWPFTKKKVVEKKVVSRREPYPSSGPHRQQPRYMDNDDSAIVNSMLIGAITDNAIIGALSGGSLLGGIIGESLSNTDDTPSRSYDTSSSDSSSSYEAESSSSSYDSGSSYDSSSNYGD